MGWHEALTESCNLSPFDRAFRSMVLSAPIEVRQEILGVLERIWARCEATGADWDAATQQLLAEGKLCFSPETERVLLDFGYEMARLTSRHHPAGGGTVH